MDKFIPDGIYIYIYIYIYIQSWKQFALPVITTMALWQLMHFETWCTSCTPCAQVHELPQSHCGDNREGRLFSWLYIYITPILLLWDLSTLCVVDLSTSDHLHKYIHYINIHTRTYTYSIHLYIYLYIYIYTHTYIYIFIYIYIYIYIYIVER